MSLANEPERLTVASTRFVTTQRPPRLRSTVRRTCPATAPLTVPESRAEDPRTLIWVWLGARAPATWPTEETRALDVGASGTIGATGAIGATGTPISTGGCGVGVGVGT